MIEPRELLAARQHLARAEATYRSKDGLFQLEEGLALLDEVIAAPDTRHRVIAQNLASTYAAKIYNAVARLLDNDRAVPEPDLEHLLRVILAFDNGAFDLPAEARATKIAIARQLLDRYYEGHPAEAKLGALEELARLAGAGRKT
jgi:hypothetical protein